MSKSINTPAHDVRYGAVRVAIWENQSESGPFYAITVTSSPGRTGGIQVTRSKRD